MWKETRLEVFIKIKNNNWNNIFHNTTLATGIGRTGRVGNVGKATSFYDDKVDRNLAADLVKHSYRKTHEAILKYVTL
jgi:superfamily II DNA/RNA helicase